MNVPKIRFKEFSEEWTQVKLNNYATKITKKNKNLIINNVISNSAIYGLISQRDFFDKDIANNDNLSSYYIIENNNFVYNPRKSNEAPYGPINRYTQLQKGVISPLYLCFSVKNINELFLEKYFKSNKWHRYIYLNGDSGARADRVSIKDDLFFNQSIYIPSMKEQSKIANTLELLDKKIELQSQKIEALKLYKLSTRNKLFYEIKNYNIKKIKDVLNFEQPTKYIVESNEYSNNNKFIPVLTANKAFILGYCNENNYYDKGDSIIFDDFTLDMKYTNFKYKVKSSAIKILTAKEQNNLKYIFEFLENLNLSSKEHKRHYISVVQELEIKIPNYNEQNEIALILDYENKKINLEIIKLNKLIELKKGLIQNIFV